MGGRHCKETHILDKSTWLRYVIQQNSKLKKSVVTLEGFTTEPFICQTTRVFEPVEEKSHQNIHAKNKEVTGIEDAKYLDEEKENIDSKNNNNMLCLKGNLSIKRAFNAVKDNADDDSSQNIVSVFKKEGIKHFKVNIQYKNRKDRVHNIHWIIKTASYINKKSVKAKLDNASFISLMQEINVYQVLINEISTYLRRSSNRPQAKFLLNLPELIYAEYKNFPANNMESSLKIQKKYPNCNLVLEDILYTKDCYPVGYEYVATGLTLSQFKVFLATLAQIHGVGISWKMKNAETFQNIIEKYPYLDGGSTLRSSENKNQEEFEECLKMYEQLLNWYYDGDKTVRQVMLLAELKKQYIDSNRTLKENTDSLPNGLCLGKITARALSYQYEDSKASDDNTDSSTKCNQIKDNSIQKDNNPVCAAVNEVHLFHFGNIFKELAYLFYILPDPICRSHYLVPLIELYSDVLRQTFEMLDLDWKTVFDGLNIVKVLHHFFHYISEAIIDTIIVQMKHTNVIELTNICKNLTKPSRLKDTVVEGSNDNSIPSKFIPLSIERIQYLIDVLNLIYKPI